VKGKAGEIIQAQIVLDPIATPGAVVTENVSYEFSDGLADVPVS
jgi:hypothetical protein